LPANFKYIFGPIQSRRLGVSLGINYLPPKSCNFDCLYCECGPTDKRLSVVTSFVGHQEITAELDQFLSTAPTLDYITFSGSGEPTLYRDIDKIIHFLKANYPQYKVALITNGTLLQDNALLAKIADCDLIIPSLDAASEKVFLKINRPNNGLHLSHIVLGLKNLEAQFKGKIWLELFFMKGINDHPQEILAFRNILKTLHPDKIQLNSIDRHPAYQVGGELSYAELVAISELLDLPNIEIINKREN